MEDGIATVRCCELHVCFEGNLDRTFLKCSQIFFKSSLNQFELGWVGAVTKKLVPINRKIHAQKGWSQWNSHEFVSERNAIPLVGAEMARAAMLLPIAFIAQGNDYHLNALTSLEPRRNLFINDEGQWLGTYVPTALRAYPFALANTEDGQRLLCFDEASGLMKDCGEGVIRFFDDDGEISVELAKVRDFLTSIDQNRVLTEKACQLFSQFEILEPWTITGKSGDGEVKIQGLFRIDEKALNKLDGERFLELRAAGALTIAYLQLLSMTNLPLLGRLAEAHVQRASEMAEIMAESFMPADSDDLQFNFD